MLTAQQELYRMLFIEDSKCFVVCSFFINCRKLEKINGGFKLTEHSMINRFEEFTNGISKLFKMWHKIAANEMEKYDLNASHVIYILALYRHSDGLTAMRLSEISDKDKADVSRALNLMMKRGLVEKKSTHLKGYGGTYFLTENGMNTAEEIREKVEHAVELVDVNLTEYKRNIFYEVLELITNNLSSMGETGLSENKIEE